MNLSYRNNTIQLKRHNKIFIGNSKDYYEFLDIIYDKSCVINGNNISKNFKLYNFCDYEYYKNSKKLKRNTLLNDYLLLKIRDIGEQQKNDIGDRIFNIMDMLNKELGISKMDILDDWNGLFYTLVAEQDININELSIEEMLEYIITNTDNNYLIIYDSSLVNLEERDNIILFDLNNHLEMSEYNILFSGHEFKNLIINVIVENLYMYWPLPIEKHELECEINNKFLTIFSSSKIYSYEPNSLIIAKLINYFYQRSIDIKYYGNDNTIKSFLSSNLNY